MSDTKAEETKSAKKLLKELQSQDAPDRAAASAILYVESSSSFCGECGQHFLWTEKHEEVSGYGPTRKGCGAKFVAVTPVYAISDEEVAELEKDSGLPVVRSSPFPRRYDAVQ